jgi:hypothetical protein
MIATFARRAILRSALAGGVILMSGRSVFSAAGAPGGALDDAVGRRRNVGYDIDTLLKYAGEFGGSGKESTSADGSFNGRL